MQIIAVKKKQKKNKQLVTSHVKHSFLPPTMYAYGHDIKCKQNSLIVFIMSLYVH